MKKALVIVLVLVMALLASCKNQETLVDKGEYTVEKRGGDYKIYRIDGEEKQEEIYTTITVNGDWLYYGDLTGKVYKIQTNGRQRTLVFDAQPFFTYDEDGVNYLYVLGENVFFRCDGFMLYKYNCATKLTKLIYWDARRIRINDGKMYLLGKDYSIFEMALSEDEPTAILSSKREGVNEEAWTDIYKDLIFVDNIMYYYKRNADGLYKFQNGQSTLIDNTPSFTDYGLFEYENILYYMVYENGTIWKLKEYNPSTNAIKNIATVEDYKNLSGSISNDNFIYLTQSGEVMQIEIK